MKEQIADCIKAIHKEQGKVTGKQQELHDQMCETLESLQSLQRVIAEHEKVMIIRRAGCCGNCRFADHHAELDKSECWCTLHNGYFEYARQLDWHGKVVRAVDTCSYFKILEE
jgi:hypothetical protein